MSGAGQIAREVGQADADEHDLTVAQLAGGDGGHHLGGSVRRTGGPRSLVSTHNSPRHTPDSPP